MFVRENKLCIKSSDIAEYSDRMKMLCVGSIVQVLDEKYRIIGLDRIEIAFGQVIIYLDVKVL
ncbi:hypothetical protein [Psychrobacillus sp. FSL H8-0510]|uniref:hypothetical protein n=1 Tax=Psychrobacillus sp. FSL H8-0510 TaxID=2921394 RepID=UPI0030FA6161